MKRDRATSASLFLAPVLVALVAVVLSAAGRQGPPQAIRVSTRLVTVSAVVTDKSGAPVSGLTKDDFVILDGGHAQKLDFLSAVTNAPPPAPPPLLPSDTYTNVLAQRGSTPDSITVILFDTLNSHWMAQGYGLSQVRKFLREIQPDEHVGLYVLSSDGLRIAHEFTENSAALVAAIRRYDERAARVKSDTANAPSGTGDLELDRLLSGKENRTNFPLERAGANRALQWEYLELQRSMTVAVLQAIGRHLASVEGRKSLIWVTDGLPISSLLGERFEEVGGSHPLAGVGILPTYLQSNMERLVRLMTDSGIAIYPVSAEGLLANDLGFAARGTFGHLYPDPWPHVYMRELAERTGGRAFYNRNDIRAGIRRALDDSRLTYSMGYYPDHNQWNGEFRKIQVKVNRPGVTVLARQGYFALPDARALPAKDRVQFLSQVAASPVEAVQIPFTVHMDVPPDAGPGAMLAKVGFDPETLAAKAHDNRLQGQFEIVFFQLDRKNKILDVTTETVDLNLHPTTPEKATQGTMELPVKLQLKPHVTLLTVIFRDRNSDTVGSVQIPMQKYLSAIPN